MGEIERVSKNMREKERERERERERAEETEKTQCK